MSTSFLFIFTYEYKSNMLNFYSVVLMFVSALINNLRRGNFWVLRLQGGKSSVMPYIVLNGSTSWLFPGTLFFSSEYNPVRLS